MSGTIFINRLFFYYIYHLIQSNVVFSSFYLFSSFVIIGKLLTAQVEHVLMSDYVCLPGLITSLGHQHRPALQCS